MPHEALPVRRRNLLSLPIPQPIQRLHDRALVQDRHHRRTRAQERNIGQRDPPQRRIGRRMERLLPVLVRTQALLERV